MFCVVNIVTNAAVSDAFYMTICQELISEEERNCHLKDLEKNHIKI